jgi:hypothetical protein
VCGAMLDDPCTWLGHTDPRVEQGSAALFLHWL